MADNAAAEAFLTPLQSRPEIAENQVVDLEIDQQVGVRLVRVHFVNLAVDVSYGFLDPRVGTPGDPR